MHVPPHILILWDGYSCKKGKNPAAKSRDLVLSRCLGKHNQQELFLGKIPVPASEPVDLASQSMSMKKEETKSKEILPGVTIKGGGVNVNLDKEDSRTLEVRPHSQTQLTLKQKF